MEVKINGNIIESRTMRLVYQLSGITAKSNEANMPMAKLYLRSHILNTKKVSTTASTPIKIRGTEKSVSIECMSDEGFNDSGYPRTLNTAARNIGPKYG